MPKIGAGTLTMPGANSYTGATVVSGTLTQTGPSTLTVTNAGVELVKGDTFQLFNGSALIGGSALIITPAPGGVLPPALSLSRQAQTISGGEG